VAAEAAVAAAAAAVVVCPGLHVHCMNTWALHAWWIVHALCVLHVGLRAARTCSALHACIF
jgi:hypothetical protein